LVSGPKFEKSSGQYFDLRERKGQEDEENCRMRSFILGALKRFC
jgi:hypothetical protein